jgi:hypothetical protein
MDNNSGIIPDNLNERMKIFMGSIVQWVGKMNKT